MKIYYKTFQPFSTPGYKYVVLNPADSLEKLIEAICNKEERNLMETAQLYLLNGIPLDYNTTTVNYSLLEWFLRDEDRIYVIFTKKKVYTEDTRTTEVLTLNADEFLNVEVTGDRQCKIQCSRKESHYSLYRKISAVTGIPSKWIKLYQSGNLIQLCEKSLISDLPTEFEKVLRVTICFHPKRQFCDAFTVKDISPLHQQTPEGLHIFFSLLFIISHYVAIGCKDLEVLSYILQLTACPPLVMSLAVLFDKRMISAAQKVAIQEGLYELFRALANIHSGSKIPANRIYENSYKYWQFLFSQSKTVHKHLPIQFDRIVLLKCSICANHLPIPCKSTFEGYPLCLNCANSNKAYTDDICISQLLRALPLEDAVSYWDLDEWFSCQTAIPTEFSVPITEDIPDYLQICTVRDLKNTPHRFSPPRLIHNGNNHVVVFTGRTGKVGNPKTHFVFDPLQGMDSIHDLNDIEFKQHVSYLKGSMHISEYIQQPPHEATVILLDVSESMKLSTRPFFSKKGTNPLTKLTVARHFFAAFCRQSAAYGFKHVLALTLFNDMIVNKCMLSECIEALAHILIPQSEKFQTSGDTYLWDAIYSACKQLQDFSLKYPKSVKRILCLTDGSDSGSERNVLDCANILCKNAIVLDMILIGRNNADARGLSYMSGGFPFYFEDISDALCIAEAEPLVSVRARQLSHPVMSSTDINKTTFDKYKKYHNAILIVKNVPPLSRAVITSSVLTTTEADRDNEAYRYLRMKDTFQDERKLLNPISALDKVRGLGEERRSARSKRILKELLYVAREKVTTFDDQPIAIYTFALPDIDKWKGIMPCPEKSPYGEKILFSVSFPLEYPETPPQVRFETPILHPNISGDGLVCHYLLRKSWYSQDHSMRTILREISLLLKIPFVQDCADSIRMEEYSRDESYFNERSSELARCVQVAEPIIDTDSDSELPEEGEAWYLED